MGKYYIIILHSNTGEYSNLLSFSHNHTIPVLKISVKSAPVRLCKSMHTYVSLTQHMTHHSMSEITSRIPLWVCTWVHICVHLTPADVVTPQTHSGTVRTCLLNAACSTATCLIRKFLYLGLSHPQDHFRFPLSWGLTIYSRGPSQKGNFDKMGPWSWRTWDFSSHVMPCLFCRDMHQIHLPKCSNWPRTQVSSARCSHMCGYTPV